MGAGPGKVLTIMLHTVDGKKRVIGVRSKEVAQWVIDLTTERWKGR